MKLHARRISENSAEIEVITAKISALLEGDDTYRCLLTVPWVGRKTASEFTISIDIEDFPGHDRLASYCGLAPRNRQTGTSISSVTTSRQDNRRLKNLLIFSCNCLTRTEGRRGDYYTRCRERSMSHGKEFKALARKKLKASTRSCGTGCPTPPSRSASSRLVPTGRMAWRQHAAIRSHRDHFPVDKTIGTPPRRFCAAACICDSPFI